MKLIIKDQDGIINEISGCGTDVCIAFLRQHLHRETLKRIGVRADPLTCTDYTVIVETRDS